MNSQREFLDRYSELFYRGTSFVTVTIVEVLGSTPQDVGSRMIVTEAGLDWGTVGGGRLEAKALDEAARLIAEKLPQCFVDWSLKADVGMTCGGRIKLYFELIHLAPWSITIFGAGHVAQSVAALLMSIPCKVTCIDPRREWLNKLPADVIAIETDQPTSLVDGLFDSTYILCMTRGHQSDLPILQRIFSTGRTFPFVGVIGSQAKAAVLRKELQARGLAEDAISFHCPVGLALGSNHPGEIAISIVAQLLQVRDKAT